jgi:carbon storage regulator
LLVLSRHKDEQIVIANGDIVITVVDIRGDKVRIGVDAPISTPVHRAEVQRIIDRDGPLPRFRPALPPDEPRR